MSSFQVHPDLAKVPLGAVYPMGIEIPHFHSLLRGVQNRGGVEPAWFFEGMPTYLVTGYDDVRRAFLDTDTFSPRATQEMFTFPILGPTFLGYEGKEHTLHRRVVNPQFSRRRSTDYVESLLLPQAHSIVDRFCGNGDAELMSEFCELYPLAVIGGLLGLPVDDWHKMAGWARTLILGDGGSKEEELEHRKEVAEEFRKYVRPLLAERRGKPSDDVLSLLSNGKIEDEDLSDEAIFSFMLLLFPAGVDTTWLAIGSMMTIILRTPGASEDLRSDEGLRRWAVEEALRCVSSVAMQPRVVVKDTELSGVAIPKGSLATLAIAAANRDPSHFEDPDRFWLERRPTDHLAFSFGQHFCLGAHLARAEMLAALSVLLDRLPNLRLSEEPRYMGGAIRGPNAVSVRFDITAPGSR